MAKRSPARRESDLFTAQGEQARRRQAPLAERMRPRTLDEAARSVGKGADDAAEVASMVKAYVGDMSVALAQDCLQVHGGIGYTWEHDLHLFMRRISGNNVWYGTPGWHRERICAMHGLGAEQHEREHDTNMKETAT